MPRDPADADLIGELTADHLKVQRLFERVRAAGPGSAERKELTERVTIELVRHGALEKEHLYPAVREHLPGGAEWEGRELAEHAGIERVLAELERRGPAEEEFDRLLLVLVDRVTAHLLEEEQRLFPRMQAVCPAGLLRELGGKVRAGRAAAPTRPRPPAPRTAPAVRPPAPGTGLLDRVRDFLTGRGRRASG
ncbi:hemerythrin domain-containing protein [Streptomyces hesseae]|uniref:Hemerythrin domain-containing protein n=1 Tax=Streptomyces hesseae TaxID=3075519 RepID=A0ABU2SJD5_9ACTN|nr:hemerythrin domain-containing protein [Streptomyces sp. DSM 40473]MDT0448504.1 hemerythrin domain-containing protein [Streptomyces sp. DSM 40473]